MNESVTIEDDADHPEGGHARLRFRGITQVAETVTLGIEALTDGVDYRGPRRVEARTRPGRGGLEVFIGPDVVGNLKQGLAVNLTLEDLGKSFDVLWPVLTPPRAPARRSALSNRKPRRTVLEDSAKLPDEGPPVKTPPPDAVRENASAAHEESVGGTVMERPTDPLEPADATGSIEHTADALTPKTAAALVPETPRGWSFARVAAVGIGAFVAGGGSFATLAWLRPSPIETSAAKPTLVLPSPYALLANLPDRSPEGTLVKTGDRALFRSRGRTAKSPQEAEFWRLWAVRALLDAHTTDSAAVLDDFATSLALSRKAEADLVAAHFMWELAAIGKDCTAMDNIAIASRVPGSPDATDVDETWRKRAAACRAQAASTR